MMQNKRGGSCPLSPAGTINFIRFIALGQCLQFIPIRRFRLINFGGLLGRRHNDPSLQIRCDPVKECLFPIQDPLSLAFQILWHIGISIENLMELHHAHIGSLHH